MQRFFYTSKPLRVDNSYEFENDIAHQIIHVLRMSTGENVLVLNNKGGVFKAEITIQKKSVTFRVISKEDEKLETNRNVHLYMSLLKKNALFELCIQKATELGATEITPMTSDHSQVHTVSNMSRLKNIIREGSEQSERLIMPKLNKATELKEIAQEAKQLSETEYLFFLERATSDNNQAPKTENMALVIGPEGGFSKEEVALIEKLCASHKNCHIVSLGSNILRAETACIAALSHTLIDIQWTY